VAERDLPDEHLTTYSALYTSKFDTGDARAYLIGIACGMLARVPPYREAPATRRSSAWCLLMPVMESISGI